MGGTWGCFFFCVAFQLSFSNYCSKSVCWVSHSCVIPASGVFMPCWRWNSDFVSQNTWFHVPRDSGVECLCYVSAREKLSCNPGTWFWIVPWFKLSICISPCEYKREMTDLFLVSKFYLGTDSWRLCKEWIRNQMDPWDIGTSLEFNIIVTGALGVGSKD